MRTSSLSRLLATCVAASCALTAHAQTPYLVKDLNPGSASGGGGPIGAAGGTLMFGGTDGPNSGFGLWATDGTAASTRSILPGLFLSFQESLELGDALVGSTFSGTDSLWRTDGTPGGTRPISAVPIGGLNRPFYIHPSEARHGMAGYFGDVSTGITDLQPFVTDGTVEGTRRVPYPLGVTQAHFENNQYTGTVDAFRGGFAYASGIVTSPPAASRCVWLYDPTTHRTTELDFFPGNEACYNLRAADERLFVNCGELCVTDGTASGSRVIDLPAPMNPWAPISALNGLAFFQVTSELWRSDGTVGGTVPMASIAPVLTGLTIDGYNMVSGSVLYFAATSAATGRELWRTDGTAAGTFLLKDIDPGPGSGLPLDVPALSFVPVAGGLVFWAGTPATGFELWKTDGTSAGTVALPEIVPGPTSAAGFYLIRAGSHVYFGADDGVHGRELWAIALPEGAVSVEDAPVVREGDTAGGTATFTVRLQSPASQPVVVAYTTVAGTAQAASDFLPATGTLTFAPGDRETSVQVAIVADDADERDESFQLALTNATGAPIADGHAVGVILDDDGPRITVAGASVVEGDSGTTDASFAVTVTTGDGEPTTRPITVRAEVVGDTAGAGDFPSPASPLPSVTFPAGTASGTTLPLLIPVLGDTLEEPNEIFSLALDSGNDAVLPAVAPVGVILDDDGIAANPPVEIAHGSRIAADLAPPAGRTTDVDFYVLRHDLHSSYEIVVDAVSGDAAPLLVERVVADGGVFQTAQPTGTGNSVALRFFGLGVSTDHIRVRAKDCGPSCGADDTYRLRMYETTLRAPRVNSVGLQSTALVLQNTTAAPVQAVAAFWSDGGSLAGLHLATVAPHGTTVVDLGTIVPQFAGSLTVGHDAPYGTLVGKVVSADPSTGIAFDTPLTSKPR